MFLSKLTRAADHPTFHGKGGRFVRFIYQTVNNTRLRSLSEILYLSSGKQ